MGTAGGQSRVGRVCLCGVMVHRPHILPDPWAPGPSPPQAAGRAVLRLVLDLAGPGGVPGAQKCAGHCGGTDSHLDGPLLLPLAAPIPQHLPLPHLLHQEGRGTSWEGTGASMPGPSVPPHNTACPCLLPSTPSCGTAGRPLGSSAPPAPPSSSSWCCSWACSWQQCPWAM